MAYVQTKIHPCKLCGTLPIWAPTSFLARSSSCVLACINERCLNPHTSQSMADPIGEWNRMMAPIELDAATVERCAQIAETTRSGPIYYGKDGAPNAAVVIGGDIIASAIRSLIPNSAGALEASHRRAPAGESDPAVTQDSAPAGTASEQQRDPKDTFSAFKVLADHFGFDVRRK